MMAPRYPDIRIRLHSRNPFAVVSAVRLALRRSGARESEILRFTEEALEQAEPEKVHAVCSQWAEIELGSC